ncbi:MAG TPA: DNA translocase FtsK, partial [Solirubrobacteraceae bacterium]|nr:DNA translocase FtsK [Solirubrobacteraceae bacterium]
MASTRNQPARSRTSTNRSRTDARAPTPKRGRAPARGKRGQRKRLARRGGSRRLVLQQHHLDLIGLGAIAVAVFLGFLLYGHGDGGQVGRGLINGLADLVGQLRYGAPVALAVAGARLLLGPVLDTGRAPRVGTACVICAALLAYAGGTFGLGAAGAHHLWFRLDYVRPRGGLAGEALFYGAAHLVSTLGADILAVFLLIAGVLLVTGSSPGV